MSGWRAKLDVFLGDFEHMDDLSGVLVCGSYITGNPTSRSDLDVHIILDNRVDYRQRGNRIIDGLMIEYFANPPKQILRYFEEDIRDNALMSQVQFATGEIILDKTGEAATLKEKALLMIEDFYQKDRASSMDENTKYGLWDQRDNLRDAYETNRPDFDFLYFNFLNKMIETYMKSINRPYGIQAILGNISDDSVRQKYLLRKLPDGEIGELITKAITAVDRDKKLEAYENLTAKILDKFGGFRVDGFKFKGGLEV